MHLATGLALAACRQGRKVRFWTVAGLVNELLLAQDEHRFNKLIAATLKLDLVVLDELGFIPFSSTGAQRLSTFCSELYERVRLIVTTNLKFADWVQVFGDEAPYRCPARPANPRRPHCGTRGRILPLSAKNARRPRRMSQDISS